MAMTLTPAVFLIVPAGAENFADIFFPDQQGLEAAEGRVRQPAT